MAFLWIWNIDSISLLVRNRIAQPWEDSLLDDIESPVREEVSDELRLRAEACTPHLNADQGTTIWLAEEQMSAQFLLSMERKNIVIANSFREARNTLQRFLKIKLGTGFQDSWRVITEL